MKELLQNFTIEQILVFVVLLAGAIKGVISFFDWVAERLRKVFNGQTKKEQETQNAKELIQKLFDMQKKTGEDIKQLSSHIDLLMESDKDDIKAWITREHHYFCYTLGYIDDYSLDCIEKRYKHYQDEGGNSFIADLMKELRALPKRASIGEKEDSRRG